MEIITKPKAGVYFVVLDDKKGCHNVAAYNQNQTYKGRKRFCPLLLIFRESIL